jgi:HD-GYP domain-containing protein (c-di-GMP phosphodiesterase class II)
VAATFDDVSDESGESDGSSRPPRRLTTSAEERWRSHPVAGAILRVAVFAVPLVLSVVAATATARALPAPVGTGQTALWWVAVLAVSTLVLIAGEGVARRVLPLVALLRLSLLFPGSAPSRLLVTRQSTKRELRRLVAEVQANGLDDDPAVAARTIVTLVGALNTHDRGTRGHSERVRAVTDLLAEQLDLDEPERDRLRWAALLHDVGKLLVPHGVLTKEASLSHHEWETIKAHPEAGDRLVAPMRAWLGQFGLVMREHHERWDGGGYPAGLAGEEISWGARVVAVADAYEVMTAARSYQGRPRTPGAAREELVRCAGAQFDPAVVRAFLNLSTRRLWLLLGPMAWLAQIPLVGSIPQTAGQIPQMAMSSATAKLGVAVSAALLVGGADLTTGATERHDGRGEQLGEEMAVVDEPATASDLRPVTPEPPVTDPAVPAPIGAVMPPADDSDATRHNTLTEDARPAESDLGTGAPPTTATPAPERRTNSPAPADGHGAPPESRPPPPTSTPSSPPPNPPPPPPAAAQEDPTSTDEESGPAPSAEPDRATVSPGERIVLDVLANDRGGLVPGTLRVTSPPRWGLAWPSSGRIVYRSVDHPPAADHFAYRVCDGAGQCADGAVHVVVRPGG